MTRRLLALLAVITLLISSGALAETLPSEGGPAACSVMHIPDTNHSLSLTTFIPDAGCWYEGTITLMAESGAFAMTASFAKYLLVILYGIYGITALLDKKARAQWVKMTIATIAVGSLLFSPASRDDLTSYIRVTMLNSWADLYEASAGYAQGLLGSDNNEQGSLGNYVRSLMEQMATLEYNSTVFERVRGDINSKLESQELGANADEIKANVMAILNEDQARSQPQFDSMSLWTTLGSFLVMGLFTVFAALIYSTAINLIITALMLPIQLAFVGVLQWGYFTKGLIGFAASLITTVMVSVFAVAVMKIAIGAPASTMTQHMADSNRMMEQSIVSYAQQWETCSWDVGCEVQNFVLDLGVQAQSVRSMVVTLGLTLLMVIVSSGIAMNQLRRIPAAISGAIGISGGGESSGTGSNPLGTLATAAGVTALSNKIKSNMANRMAGGGGGAGGTPSLGNAAKNAGKDGASGGADNSGSPGKGANSTNAAGGSQGAEGPSAPARPPEAEGAAEGKALNAPSLGERAANYISNLPTDRVAASRQLLADSGRGMQRIADRTGDRQLLDRIGTMASPVARGVGNAAERLEQTREALQSGGLKGMVEQGQDRVEMAKAQVGAVQMALADRAYKSGAPNANVRPSQRPAPTPSEAGQRFQQNAQAAYGNANVRTIDMESSGTAGSAQAALPAAGAEEASAYNPAPDKETSTSGGSAPDTGAPTSAAESASSPAAGPQGAGAVSTAAGAASSGTPGPQGTGAASSTVTGSTSSSPSVAVTSSGAASGTPPSPPSAPAAPTSGTAPTPAEGVASADATGTANANAASVPPPPPVSPVPGHGPGEAGSRGGSGLRARADAMSTSRAQTTRGQLGANDRPLRVDPNATAPYRPATSTASTTPAEKGSAPTAKTTPATGHVKPDAAASASPARPVNTSESVATNRSTPVLRAGETPLPTAANGGRLQATPARPEASYLSANEAVRDYKSDLPKDRPAPTADQSTGEKPQGAPMTIEEARTAPAEADLPTSESVGERPST